MEEILKQIMEKLNSLDTEVKKGLVKLNSLETDVRTGFEGVEIGLEGVNKKLDTIYAQVAHNTEQEVKLNEVVAIVEEHDTDIKLIKKVITINNK